MHIATLSKGVDHICLPKNWVKKIISATGDANAPAVADHTLMLASQLLRPADQAATEMSQQVWNIKIDSESHQFDSFEWGCIGSGAQVKYLLPQLITRRCPIIRVFHPEMDYRRLLNAVSHYSNPHQVSVTEKTIEFTFINPTGDKTIIIGTRNDKDVFSYSDIISLHIPVVKTEESKYGYGTHELINTHTIAKMKKGVYLINPARGALVNENDIVNALLNGYIGGIASDVVHPKAEHTEDPRFSPLWQLYCKAEKEKKNGQLRRPKIYLTPHVGGGTVEAINIIAGDVISQLIQSLCISLKNYQEFLI